MTPQQFIAKWKQADLSERSAAQQHFLARSRHSLRFRPQLQDVPDGSRATMRARALVELTAVAMATALVHQVAPLGTLNVMEHGHVDNQNGPEPAGPEPEQNGPEPEPPHTAAPFWSVAGGAKVTYRLAEPKESRI